MRKPEQRFWDRARPHLLQARWVERIENIVADGMPDTVVLNPVNGTTRFVEFKAVEKWPLRPTTKVLGPRTGLRQTQLNWFLNWNRLGGKSGILIGIGSHEVVYLDGNHSEEVNSMTKEQMLRLGASSWEEILRII